ncbi:MAG: hypothetical protein ABIW38_00060, partial [Ferruginibacter sp.]
MKITALLTLIFFYPNIYAQRTISIEGFGKITCPEKMELQAGSYKEYVEKVKEINGVPASKVIFQQKGLNNGDGGFDTYARVMIRTVYGDFNTLISRPTTDDVNDVNSSFKQQINSEAYQNNAKIISWNNAISTTINGYPAIKFGYKRQIGSNPIVSVETYIIQNSDRMYSITFE